jgi:uncharacterized protein (TIGR00369 family)
MPNDNQVPDIVFPSGFRRLVGYQITHWAENEAKVAVALDQRHKNRAGYVHGGVITTLIDTAGGLAGCYCPEPGHVRRCATISLSTQFLGAVQHGTIVAHARVRGGGKRLFGATVEVHDQAGALIATGEAMYRYRTGHEDKRGVPREDAGLDDVD